MIPRETCIADPVLLWSLILGNLAVALAYGLIPWGLWRIHRAVPSAPFPRLGRLFVAFISLCGGTHLMAAAVFFWAIYYLEAAVMVATAAVSLTAALTLLRLHGPIVAAVRDYLTLLREFETSRAQLATASLSGIGE